MEEYKDRIGDLAYGLDENGNIAYVGWYLGIDTNNDKYAITGNNYNKANPKTTGTNYFGIKFVETMSEELKHYGKPARVWDTDKVDYEERLLLTVNEDGSCITISGGKTLDDFKSGMASNTYWKHYKLVEDTKKVGLDIELKVNGEVRTIDEVRDLLKELDK